MKIGNTDYNEAACLEMGKDAFCKLYKDKIGNPEAIFKQFKAKEKTSKKSSKKAKKD